MRRLRALVGTVLLLGTLSGCGLDVNAAVPYRANPGVIGREAALDGVRLTVGSKDFTENILLGYMAELALSAAGANVVDLTDIKGSNSARQALLNGQVDLYWEYSGTGWINYQGNELPVPGGERAQYDATKAADEQKNDVTWLPYSPVNNQYVFAVTEDYAKQHKLNNVSDLAEFLKRQPDQAVFCLETEFISRQDGFPGAVKTYGFPVTQVKNFGTGTIYPSVATGVCPIGEVYTTSGMVPALHLKLLTDDKQTFPQYNAAVTMKKETLATRPALPNVLNKVAAAIDNPQMIELCRQVDVEGKDAAKVAYNWMKSKGLIT